MTIEELAARLALVEVKLEKAQDTAEKALEEKAAAEKAAAASSAAEQAAKAAAEKAAAEKAAADKVVEELKANQVTWGTRGLYAGVGVAAGAALGSVVTYYVMKPV